MIYPIVAKQTAISLDIDPDPSFIQYTSRSEELFPFFTKDAFDKLLSLCYDCSFFEEFSAIENSLHYEKACDIDVSLQKAKNNVPFCYEDLLLAFQKSFISSGDFRDYVVKTNSMHLNHVHYVISSLKNGDFLHPNFMELAYFFVHNNSNNSLHFLKKDFNQAKKQYFEKRLRRIEEQEEKRIPLSSCVCMDESFLMSKSKQFLDQEIKEHTKYKKKSFMKVYDSIFEYLLDAHTFVSSEEVFSYYDEAISLAYSLGKVDLAFSLAQDLHDTFSTQNSAYDDGFNSIISCAFEKLDFLSLRNPSLARKVCEGDIFRSLSAKIKGDPFVVSEFMDFFLDYGNSSKDTKKALKYFKKVQHLDAVFAKSLEKKISAHFED